MNIEGQTKSLCKSILEVAVLDVSAVYVKIMSKENNQYSGGEYNFC